MPGAEAHAAESPVRVRGNRTLPAALQEVARLWGPSAETLKRWMKPVAGTDDADVWSSSLLAPGGFPVEVSYCSATPRTARWAADPSSHRVTPGNRLDVTLARLARRDVPALHGLAADIVGLLARAQRAATDLTWGAWIGARVDEDSCRWKVYVEVPRSAAPFVHAEVARMLGGRPLPVPRSALRMVAVHVPGPGGPSPGIECYYILGGLSPQDVRAIGDSAGCPEGADGVLALAEAIVARPLGVGLPGGRHRVSLSHQPSGRVVMSVIAPARRWIGDDPAIRRRLLTVGRCRGDDTWLYERLTAGCSRLDRRAHGLLTLASGARRAAHWTVGMSPVATIPYINAGSGWCASHLAEREIAP